MITPDGTIDSADRASLLGLYGSIAAPSALDPGIKRAFLPQWRGPRALRPFKPGLATFSPSAVGADMVVEVSLSNLVSTADSDYPVVSSVDDDGIEYPVTEPGAWWPSDPLASGWSDAEFSGRGNVGLRFPAIAASGSVTAAKIVVNVTSVTGNPDVNVYADDVDDAPAWAAASLPSGITQTAATVQVVPAGTGLLEIIVTGIVNEILARGGWASGQDMRVALFDNTGAGENYFVIESLDDAGSNPAKMVVTASVPIECGVVYRGVDQGNYWAAYVDAGDNLIHLSKFVGGVEESVATYAWTPADTAEIRVIAQANRHRVWVDRLLAIDEEDGDLNYGNLAGLFSRSTTAVLFDNWYAEGL